MTALSRMRAQGAEMQKGHSGDIPEWPWKNGNAALVRSR